MEEEEEGLHEETVGNGGCVEWRRGLCLGVLEMGFVKELDDGDGGER